MAYENDPRWSVFLRELCRLPSRSEAFKKSKLSQIEYLARCEEDADFVSAVSTAMNAGIDSLEDVAIQRAVLGVDEPVYWQGTCVGFKTVYSDRLLTFLLQGNREKYRGEGEKNVSLSEEARGTIAEAFASLQSEYTGKKVEESQFFGQRAKTGKMSIFQKALREVGSTANEEGEPKPLFPVPVKYTFADSGDGDDSVEVMDVDLTPTIEEQAKDLGIKPKQSAKLRNRRK